MDVPGVGADHGRRQVRITLRTAGSGLRRGRRLRSLSPAAAPARGLGVGGGLGLGLRLRLGGGGLGLSGLGLSGLGLRSFGLGGGFGLGFWFGVLGLGGVLGRGGYLRLRLCLGGFRLGRVGFRIQRGRLRGGGGLYVVAVIRRERLDRGGRVLRPLTAQNAAALRLLWRVVVWRHRLLPVDVCPR